MLLKDALHEGITRLKPQNIYAPALEAGVILCRIINRDRAFLYAHGDYILSESEQARYFEDIEKRVKRIPLQYITGCQEFMSLSFAVNSSVLVPRQDTEILVETVIEQIGTNILSTCNADKIRILDIGTGSGCIAVSLAYYVKDSRITAIDVSPDALKTAEENAKANNVRDRVAFIQSNIFSELENNPAFYNYFDVIVSNPPYIPTDEIPELSPEVKDNEPLNALDGGIDGLDFYRTIIEEAGKYLKPTGFLAFEVGYDQAQKVSALMHEQYNNVRCIKDLSGIERVVTGQIKLGGDIKR